MEAPLHQFPIPPPPLPQDALLHHHAVSTRALMMAAAAGAGNNNKAAPLVTLPGPGREQCPRCASRDTKFCYYNNYNTAQPRHFCRACRRYWTLGGSLRNVPVGGSTRKRTRRPVMRPTRAMAAAVADAMAMPTMTASAGGNPFAMLLQGAAGGEGILLSSLLLGSASASPLLALGAAPMLEGRLGFGNLGLGDATLASAADGAGGNDLAHHQQQLPLGAGHLPWPASATILEGEGDNCAETTTPWKGASSVFPYPPATALWQELAAAAPAVGAGGQRHGGTTSHLLL